MDFIKNKNRGKNIPTPYIPEYKRLGIEPLPGGDFLTGLDGEIVDTFDNSSSCDISINEKLPHFSSSNDLILMIKDEVILHGSEETVISEIKKYIYEPKHNIILNDIVVLKKMNVKVGVFIE